MNEDQSFKNYTKLLEKVDKMFEAVFARHRNRFACQAGCYGCCKSQLSVFSVEARYIEAWLNAHPEAVRKIEERSAMLNDPDFCNFLDKEGGCTIYEARPVICRSHGLPVALGDGEPEQSVLTKQRDVCPLNFKGVDLDSLDDRDVMSLEHVNTLLSLINRAFDGSHGDERVRLDRLILDGP
jgi:Fe-S-cluster containining protein